MIHPLRLCKLGVEAEDDHNRSTPTCVIELLLIFTLEKTSAAYIMCHEKTDGRLG
jgi:hypothetical protein